MFSNSNGSIQRSLSAVLSLVIAAALWYFVVGRDHVETQVEIRVEYQGLPKDLLVLDGSVSHITARLRGSAELLKSLKPASYTVDLSSMHQGANQIPVDAGRITELKERGLEILQLTPSQIVLQIDNVITRNVKVNPRLLPLPKDSHFIVADRSLISEPDLVTVNGPETMVGALEELPTAPIDPSKNPSEGPKTIQAAVNAPALLELSHPVVTVKYYLKLKTTIINRDVTLRILGENAQDYELSAEKLNVNVSVPIDRAEDPQFSLNGLMAFVEPPANMLPGESRRLDVGFSGLPPQAVISSGSASSVVVTRKKVESEPVVDEGSVFPFQEGRSAFTLPAMPYYGPFPFARPSFFSIPSHAWGSWQAPLPPADSPGSGNYIDTGRTGVFSLDGERSSGGEHAGGNNNDK
ncbi:MAG: CdaR family protein [Desulfovibrio sp.]|jgi:hypothetical protein